MSTLKDKLYNSEATPPPDAWARIAAALDDSHLSDQFPERLYEMEVAPPASAWNAIENNLNEDAAPARVIPMRKRAAGFWKYAAAAMLLIISGWMIIEWTGNQNSAGENSLVVSPDSLQNEGQDLAKTVPEEKPVDQPETPIIETTSIAKKQTPAMVDRSSRQKTVERNTKRQAKEDTPVFASFQPTNVAERYVLLLTPSGNIIRMSKKLGDMVCCVSGEEQDNECRDQIKKWQEKLAASNSTTTGGFIDVLSLVSALDNDL